MLLNLGAASGSGDLHANVERGAIRGATIHDGFQLRTAMGGAILEAERGDPALCASSAEDRSRTHDEIAARVAAFLAAREQPQ